MAEKNAPDLFLLTGGTFTEIRYQTTGTDGRAELSYTGGLGEGTATGDDIDVAESRLGTEVTVPIVAIPDLKEVTLTLVLPHGLGQEPFATFAVVSTTPVPFTGRGGLQSYDVMTLHGTARFVEF